MTQLETLSVRYFNVFGPRQSLATNYAAVIPLFIRKVAEGDRPTIFGDGEQSAISPLSPTSSRQIYAQDGAKSLPEPC
jgi:nucleoside-diphosphate-sugar epimerase